VSQQHPGTGVRQPAARAGHRPHVLLLEGDYDVRQATVMLLELGGYRVTATHSAAQARLLQERGERFDIALADDHTIDRELGRACVALLRQMLGTSLPMILLMTSLPPGRELPEDTAVPVIAKPCRAEDLFAMMRSLLCENRTCE